MNQLVWGEMDNAECTEILIKTTIQKTLTQKQRLTRTDKDGDHQSVRLL